MIAPNLLLHVAAVPPPAPAPDATSASAGEVVVTARRGKCSVRVADRILSDAEFRARAADWAAGTPVRVHVADRSDYKCMARILFRLGAYGVRNAEFVGPAAR